MSDSSFQPSLALEPNQIRVLVDGWLAEDSCGLDYASCAAGDAPSKGLLYCKQTCVLAGAPFVEAVFAALGCKVEWKKSDGDRLIFVRNHGDDGVADTGSGTSDEKELVAVVRGRACDLLRGERPALNCLSRTSGVATVADRLVSVARRNHWEGRVCGTRKTTPGFRLAEKYALLVGGADTHRYDRSSMVMLKDNHIWASGSISNAVRKCKALCGFSLKMEVECRTVTEAMEAAEAGCDIIMLDNFTPKDAWHAANHLKQNYPNTKIEASGGITESTVEHFFSPHIDYVSTSCLTQGYPTIDFSMKLHRNPAM